MSLVMDLFSSFPATSIFVFVILGILMMTMYMPATKSAKEMVCKGETQYQVSNMITEEEELHAA